MCTEIILNPPAPERLTLEIVAVRSGTEKGVCTYTLKIIAADTR
jgi:hypothetical protein